MWYSQKIRSVSFSGIDERKQAIEREMSERSAADVGRAEYLSDREMHIFRQGPTGAEISYLLIDLQDYGIIRLSDFIPWAASSSPKSETLREKE